MTEVNQWLRMIQPARARTPAIEQQEYDDPSTTNPNTPKRGLRPKISSYFNLHADSGQLKHEASFGHDPLRDSRWPHINTPTLAGAEGLVETVMCRLISSPYEGLGVDMNGPLLQICEAYRGLCDREANLRQQLQVQIESHHAAALKMQQIQNRWNEERQDYRAEVKRLELLLAKGKRGLAEVTLARKDSLLWQRKRNEPLSNGKGTADDGLQTIFEVLERARHGQDQAFNLQRATFRPRAASPSAHMRCISQQLISKKSMTSVHADLPFGSPPEMAPSTLAEASMLEAQVILAGEIRQDVHHSYMEESEDMASLSEDTFSTFSAADGVAIKVITFDPPKENTEEEWGDYAALQRVANMLVHRRDADPASVVQKLVKMMGRPTGDTTKNAQFTSNLSAALAPDRDVVASIDKGATRIKASIRSEPNLVLPPRSTSMLHAVSASSAIEATTPTHCNVEGIAQRSPSIMAKASCFFQKLKPLLHGDTARVQTRRFSFEAGDDAMALSSYQEDVVAMPGLRKSASLLSVSTKSYGTMLPSNTLTSQLAVTILGPSKKPHSPLAFCSDAANQDGDRAREDSHSSLLTAINRDQEVLCKTGSGCISLSHSSHVDRPLHVNEASPALIGSRPAGSRSRCGHSKATSEHCTSASATTVGASLIETSGTSHASDHGANETSGTSCACATAEIQPIRRSSGMEFHPG